MLSFQIFALAVVATIGYLAGHWTRRRRVDSHAEAVPQYRHASQMLAELEKVSGFVRRSLASHHASVTKFQDRLRHLPNDQGEVEGISRQLSVEADRLLQPTMELSTAIARAYDTLRQQSQRLAEFQHQRTDALTGLQNREGLDEMLRVCLSMSRRHQARFCIVLFDVDHLKQINIDQGQAAGDRLLKAVADLIEDAIRDKDMVARFGGEEFVVILPETLPAGARSFADRIRKSASKHLDATLSGGVAEGTPEDTPESLLARADAALYSAKSAGRNCIYWHDGQTILAVASTRPSHRPIKRHAETANYMMEV